MMKRDVAVRVLDIMLMVVIIGLPLFLGFWLKYPWWTTAGFVVALFIAWVLARMVYWERRP